LFLVAFTDSSGQIQVYNEKEGLSKVFQAHSSTINRIRYLPNGYVATCSSDNTVDIWDPSNISGWKLIQTYTGHKGGVVSFENIKIDTIASSAYDQTIQIWSITTGITLNSITNQQNNYQNVLSLKFFSDKNGIGHLAAGLSDGNIFIYNFNSMSLVGSLSKHANQVNDLELIKNGNEILLASSSDDNSIKIWDLTTYACKFTLNDHANRVTGF
jgi:WD40 repeat protein